jgi:hypothetical protein
LIAPRRLILLLALATFGCVEDKVDVSVLMHIHEDGSCTRHIEYRLQREGGEDPAKDSFRTRFRFPKGPLWSVRDEVLPEAHVVTAEALLPSPNALGWDYWHARSPKDRPSRNNVAFRVSGHEGERSYEYLETFVDPVSPLAAMRKAVSILRRSEAVFADGYVRALESGAPMRDDVRRLYRSKLVDPLERAVRVAGPASGRWDRIRTSAALDRLEKAGDDLTEALASLSPALSREAIKAAGDKAMEPVDAALERQGGPPALASLDQDRIRFRVTLVMPAPITRANTCVAGDTATWEFDEDDLYGAGFEMWARAQAP